jgi:6-pyruvoyl-tetrahydropterin synthase
MEAILIKRKYFFSTAHIETKSYIGNDWTTEIGILGALNPNTQLVFNLIDLDIIVRPILDELNHKFVNKDVEYFFKKTINCFELDQFIFLNLEKKLYTIDSHLTLQFVKIINGNMEWAEYQRSS